MRLEHQICRQLVFLGAVTILASSAVAEQPNEADGRDRLESMTSQEKNVLLRKKKRFNALSQEQQSRMRLLHQSLASDPRSSQLRSTLVRYSEWLKTLTPEQRAKLEGLAVDKRIEKIRELRQHEQESKLRQLSPRVPIEDLRKIYAWLDEFIHKNRDEIMAKMPQRLRSQVANMTDRPQRRRLLWRTYVMRLGANDVPTPDLAEYEQLLSRLSPRGRELLQSGPQTSKNIIRWIAQTGLARSFASDEQLKRFFQNELSDDQQRRLDRLPISERGAELRRLYGGQQRGGRVLGNQNAPPRGAKNLRNDNQ